MRTSILPPVVSRFLAPNKNYRPVAWGVTHRQEKLIVYVEMSVCELIKREDDEKNDPLRTMKLFHCIVHKISADKTVTTRTIHGCNLRVTAVQEFSDGGIVLGSAYECYGYAGRHYDEEEKEQFINADIFGRDGTRVGAFHVGGNFREFQTDHLDRLWVAHDLRSLCIAPLFDALAHEQYWLSQFSPLCFDKNGLLVRAAMGWSRGPMEATSQTSVNVTSGNILAYAFPGFGLVRLLPNDVSVLVSKYVGTDGGYYFAYHEDFVLMPLCHDCVSLSKIIAGIPVPFMNFYAQGTEIMDGEVGSMFARGHMLYTIRDDVWYEYSILDAIAMYEARCRDRPKKKYGADKKRRRGKC